MVLFELHFQQRSTHRRPVSREQKKGLVVACCFLVEAKSWLHPESDHQTLFIFVEIQMLDHEGCDDMPLKFSQYDRGRNKTIQDFLKKSWDVFDAAVQNKLASSL